MSAKRIDIFNRDNPSGGNAVVGDRFIGRLFTVNRPINRSPTKHERSNGISGFNQGRGKQHGAALMVMLVILIVGAAAILVGTLTSSSLQIARDKTTADALAQARDALIGRAVSDPSSPGSLPCPDTNDDGSAELFSGTDCPSYIGRLPWKTLGLPDLRDGSGERLWYALSPGFRDLVTANPVNSDTQGSLAISGTTTANSIVAIVFSAGSALSGQSRSATQSAACTTSNSTVAESLCATNYLEDRNADPSTAASPNSAYLTGAASSTFNDQVITISHDQIFVPVETRIAREVKNCLDDYASSSANKYPWAAPVSDSTYTGTFSTLFGRISSTPNIDTTSDGPGSSAAITLSAALSALQTAVDAFNANDSGSNYTALYNAANTVISLKYSVSGISSSVDRAGDYAKYFANDSVSYSTARYYVTSAINALANHNLASVDSTMSATWPSPCTLFSSSYWTSWQNEVFYQVASGFQPGSSASFGTPLSINGSGSYRASVIVARQAFPSQTPRSISSDTSYLESANQHQTTPSNAFVTYNPSNTNFSTVNDLVLCLDGKNNCI